MKYETFALKLLDSPTAVEAIPEDKRRILEELANTGVVKACRLDETNPTKDSAQPYIQKPAEFFVSYHSRFNIIGLTPNRGRKDSIWFEIDTSRVEDHIIGPYKTRVEYKGLCIEISNERSTNSNIE
jgi:hypothetical protein